MYMKSVKEVHCYGDPELQNVSRNLGNTRPFNTRGQKIEYFIDPTLYCMHLRFWALSAFVSISLSFESPEPRLPPLLPRSRHLQLLHGHFLPMLPKRWLTAQNFDRIDLRAVLAAPWTEGRAN